MGVLFCLLFTWWFASGIFMMYWDYPEIREADRLERAAPLDGSQLHLSPQAAYRRLGIGQPPEGGDLAMIDGRPVYRFRFGFGDQRIVYADDGTRLREFPPDRLLEIASAWEGRPAREARFEGTLTEPDQWTVSGSFSPLRPLRKYSWPNGDEVYVSEVTGEVAQYTTRRSRLGAYLGAIPHWLYFTPLRKNGALWSRIVIWLSGIATAVAFVGIVVGVWMYAPSGRVPYAGPKRLHMILGLFFGILACTWAFSGMLSMDPFPLSDDAGIEGTINRALRGALVRMDVFAVKLPAAALEEAGNLRVKKLELTSFDGEAVYLATEAPGRSRIIPMRRGPAVEFDRNRILEAVKRAVQPAILTETTSLTEYDAYYLDRRHERPLPVLRVRLSDAEESRVYIDPRNAQVVGSYSSRSWISRWLYHGLHSINLPWLYTHRPVWDVVVLALLGGGTALSVTSVILACQLLRRTFARPR